MNDLGNKEDLEKYWNIFVTTGEISPSVRPIIADSWQRCADKKLSPYYPKMQSTDALTEELEKHSDSLRIVVPIMKLPSHARLFSLFHW